MGEPAVEAWGFGDPDYYTLPLNYSYSHFLCWFWTRSEKVAVFGYSQTCSGGTDLEEARAVEFEFQCSEEWAGLSGQGV